MIKFADTGQWRSHQLLLLISLLPLHAIILTGGPDSYARYPKWAHSFENSLSLEMKTKQSNGLLMYTDDGGTHGNFYSLTIVNGNIQLDFRLGDNSNEFGKRRPVNTIRIEEVRVDDDKWHTLTIFQSWENVKLELDYTLVFKILNQRSFVFGNILKNSDVFIGGLPPSIHSLPIMSSPLRRYSRHLAVNVRNLMYRQYPQGVTSPQLLEAVGTRSNEDDYCRPKTITAREYFSCHNDGYCFSTNDGAKCDCSFSDHEGRNCEIEKSDGELTFAGDEWVGYDVTSNSSAIIRGKAENLTITFKTVHGTAMLFYSGDDKSYLHLMLQDGAIIATSKFEGSDARMIRMFNSFPIQRYDDDSWHSIVLERSLHMMRLTVDGRTDEVRQYAPELDWIANSFAFIGSIPKFNPTKHVNRVSFRGCMKKIKYDIEATSMLFVNLADQSYGGSVIKTGGDLSYSCKNPSHPSDVLSFNGNGRLPLPKWNSLSSGSISFHFRTLSLDGLIMYHGVLANNATDYLAFELIDGHLYMIINLGSGVVRLQTTANKVNDGDWHHVQLDRLSRTGSVVVDAIKIDFNTPGVSSNLIVDDAIFLGNVPNNSIIYPPSIWSIALNRGFVGCLKNIRLNGVSAKLAAHFEAAKDTTGIQLGCTASSDAQNVCETNPCHNYGTCRRRLPSSFECDCTNTNFDGALCEFEQIAVKVNGHVANIHVLPTVIYSQVEHVHIRFKTTMIRGVLFDSRAHDKLDRLTIYLDESRLSLHIEDELKNNTFSWGKSLSDNQWHELQVKRLGQRLLLYLDGFWGHSIYLQNTFSIQMDEIGVAYAAHNSSPPPRDEHFRGYLSKFVFNGKDLLVKDRKALPPFKMSNKDSKGQRNVKSRVSTVSFTNTTGFILFSSEKISSLTGPFRIQFKFQTLMKSAMLFQSTSQDESIRIQLINGRLKYTYRLNDREYHVMTTRTNEHHLSDMRWHNVALSQNNLTKQHILLVDNSTTTMVVEVRKEAKLMGNVYIGGNPSLEVKGFRGCVSAVRINEHHMDLLEDADAKANVVKGCSGPVSRCDDGSCANGGRCIQLWSSIRCDCSLTAHSGKRCQNEATGIRFDGSPAAIYYEYAPAERPTTSKDYFIFSFRTTQPNGVLISIDCAADQDYFTVFLSKGYLNAYYNLGNRDHRVGYYTNPLNDGLSHVIKIARNESNLTIRIDKLPTLRYRPTRPSDLVLLNMHKSITLGASFGTRHLMENRRWKRASPEIYDSYQGEMSGVNVNGLMMLDLYEAGSNRIQTIGSVETTSVGDKQESNESDEEEMAMMMNSYEENPSEALIESLTPTCLTLEEQQSCFIDTDDTTGFFSPVIPTVETTRPPTYKTTKTTTTRKTTVSSTTPLRQIEDYPVGKLTASTVRPKSSPPYTVYPVRPTTPMGDTITTTMQSTTVADFPRTPLIMCSSLAVIVAIAAVVFFVFKCRQNPPNDQYTMAMKTQSGYTAIAPELSPPMNHDRINTDSCTQPLLAKPPQMNGNGYEPLKGSVIANGNGVATLPRNGVNGTAKKKDFKEWYV